MSEAVVVIGAGQAAAQLAASLRQGGFGAPIVVIGDEPYPPYQRPPLSKKFLIERPAPDSLYLRAPGFWDEQKVTLMLGTPVAAVDAAARRVMLADRRAIDFGILAFATGTRARALPLPGADLPGVFSVRKIDDIRQLRPALDDARRAVIVGAGYIGLEVAAGMRAEGREVTLLEAEDRVMKRVTGRAISDFFDAFHRARGVDLRLGARLAAITGEARATGVRLADGAEIAADLVLVATGAKVNDEIAAAAGIACEDGILVDESAATNVAGVYAIGDCARFPSRRYGRHIRLECVQNAIDQAKAAAAAMLGKGERYDPVPWFWSDQYDLKLQIAGLMDGHDQADTIGDPASARFSVEYRKAGRLIAVDAVNDGRAYMTARRRIAEETA
ncbi:MAG: pyridine nucleotide-disulfide oxidoreductase [Bradyrhizobiaceae bacterium]|nr:MAG: pyridine nucleotide-disulfide oxidoreductase [Bradyrhizobiaceae bacterium]